MHEIVFNFPNGYRSISKAKGAHGRQFQPLFSMGDCLYARRSLQTFSETKCVYNILCTHTQSILCVRTHADRQICKYSVHSPLDIVSTPPKSCSCSSFYLRSLMSLLSYFNNGTVQSSLYRGRPISRQHCLNIQIYSYVCVRYSSGEEEQYCTKLCQNVLVLCICWSRTEFGVSTSCTFHCISRTFF